MPYEIRSAGGGVGFQQQYGIPPSATPMDMVWNNSTSYEVSAVGSFAINLTIDAAIAGIHNRGWDYAITIENNTDPTNVTLTGNSSGTINASGSPQTFTVNLPTTSFLTSGAAIAQPNSTELVSKFGPIRGGDSDTARYMTLVRDSAKMPTSYRNQLVEIWNPHPGANYMQNFDIEHPQLNKFAVLMKIVRSNATAPAFTITDYRVLVIQFSPLIDIQ